MIMDWMKDLYDEDEITYMEQELFNQNVDRQIADMDVCLRNNEEYKEEVR